MTWKRKCMIRMCQKKRDEHGNEQIVFNEKTRFVLNRCENTEEEKDKEYKNIIRFKR